MDLKGYNENDVNVTFDILNSDSYKEYEKRINKAKHNVCVLKSKLGYIVNEILYNRAIIRQYENKINLYKERLKNVFNTFEDNEFDIKRIREKLKETKALRNTLVSQQTNLKRMRGVYEHNFSKALGYFNTIQFK